MASHREPAPEPAPAPAPAPAPDDRARPDAQGDRRYGDRAADVRPAREHDPDTNGPQDGYDATADAAARTGGPEPDDQTAVGRQERR
ncbi:hypothetical protein [Streptomyces sp. TLI_171]|uniref:hypothetical protein n=1 Tax=Streptomyces sp. TLI_171 TaxID=1938859 RepID=UPI000C198BF1|nr:hypothetical protein [Streptomyces sp. TLI_171]RKE05173.1 hypothetical protein BX266_7441 [Streptomyces sp. TLI_171]